MATIRSNKDRVRWLLDFAYRDLGALREGDWLNLREDLKAFLGQSLDVSPTVLASRKAVEFVTKRAAADWFQVAQKKVRTMLESRFSDSYPGEDNAISLHFGIVVSGYQGWTILELTSKEGAESAHSEMLFVASLALATTDSADIRLCPSCRKRLFWPARRTQKVCSSKCRHRKSYLAWLIRQAEKDRKRKK